MTRFLPGMSRNSLSELGRRCKPPPISWLMNLTLSRPGLISLAAGFIDPDTLPTAQTAAIVKEILASGHEARAALQYGSTQGDPALRKLTATELAVRDGALRSGAAYNADQVIITNGSQQLLYLLVQVLCDPGDVVLVEDPTYFVFLGILDAHGVAARGVRLERDGIDLAHLDHVLDRLCRTGQISKLKLMYFVSYAHNPTGITWSFEKKAAVLNRLRAVERKAGHPIYVVEDAAYRDLLFDGVEPASALVADRPHKRVIYAGTYSKPFATGMRVGFAILPEQITNPVLCLKGNHDFGTSNFIQQILVHAISSGVYAAHLEQLRARYRYKARVMGLAIRRHFPDWVDVWEPTGGLYYWVRLPRGVNSGPDSTLFERALGANVLYVPGRFCYAPDPARRIPDNELRLSFGNATESQIRTGVRRLGRVLHALTCVHSR